MFKTTDKISRAIDQITKATEEIKENERKKQALKVLHVMSVLHSDCLSDLYSHE